MSARSPRGTVLMYHRLSLDQTEADEGDYRLTAELFERQMQALASQGRPVLPLASLAAGGFPDGAVALTFDDGCDTDATVALPILLSLGLTATFFVNPARVNTRGRLRWGQLEELAAAGMCIGSHGLDHTLLTGLSAPELERQIASSKRLLERRLGREVEALSLPGGTGGARAVRMARAIGHRIVCGSKPALVPSRSVPAVLPRYAVRYSQGLTGFQALVEQRTAFRIGQTLGYGIRLGARATVGERAYVFLRQASLALRPQPRRA